MTIANTDQAAAWDGEEGARWTANAERYEASSRRLWERFREAVEIPEAATILDVGCGPGSSTLDAARAASSGSALGVDLSAEMLAYARDRAEREGLRNVRFEQADAQVHPFEPDSIDLCLSRFGVMFFNDPVAAFANLARAVRPGGSLALLVWRELPMNGWASEFWSALAFGRTLPAPPPEAPGPFSFADPVRVRAILERGGFRGVTFDPIDEPFEAGRDVDHAFEHIRTLGVVRALTAGLDEAQRPAVDDAIREVLVKHETAEGIMLPAAAWVIRAER